MACMVTLAACNLDYHEYANYGKDYIDESYENVIGMITNVYSILDYDFGQTYKGGMLASACDEAEYAYTNNDICDFVNGSWSPANPMSNIWTSSYKAIQICNQYLAEFQGLTFDEFPVRWPVLLAALFLVRPSSHIRQGRSESPNPGTQYQPAGFLPSHIQSSAVPCENRCTGLLLSPNTHRM